MPTEPEHNMDKTLKAYAEKRRAESGAPAELHPATRRLLQGEVARQKSAQSAQRVPWWQRLNSFWPRLAAASVIIIASFLTFRGAREDTVVETEFRNVAPVAITAADEAKPQNLATLRDELKSPAPEPDRRLAIAATPPAASIAVPAPASQPVMLAEQKEKSARADVELLRRNESLDAAGAKSAERPTLLAGPAQKPAARESASAGRSLADAPVSLAKSETEALAAGNAGQTLNWFGKLAVAPSNATDKTPAPTAASSVLDNFAVEQDGDRLSLIDSDGSTYTGALETVVLAGSYVASDASKKLSPSKDVQLDFVVPASAEAKQNAGNAYRFRASGTNRTLRKQVTVDGVLEGTPVAVSNLSLNQLNDGVGLQNAPGLRQQNAAQQNAGRYYYRVAGPQQNAPSQPQQYRGAQAGLGANVGQADSYGQQNWINANRIQGRVQIGGTNSPVQLFDAVPQSK